MRNESVEVALPIPGEGIFHYAVPEELREGVEVGKRVLVPVRKRRELGFVVGFGEPPPDIELRDVIDVVDDSPLFDEKRLEFFRWVANYYQTSLGSVLKAAHPGGLGVRLQKNLSVTERGMEFAEGGALSEAEKSVVKTIVHSGEISQSRLEGIIEGLKNETLNSLLRRGLIQYSYALHSRPKFKVEKIIHVKNYAELVLEENKRLGETKRRMLEYLLGNRRVGYGELKEIFGDISPHINWFKKKGVVEVEERRVARDPYGSIPIKKAPPPELNLDQKKALDEITKVVREGRYDSFLLHGVTGSGKTEVYLRAIAEVIEKGREAIVMVPEISLTPLLVRRFRERFGKKVAVIHSALSEGERFDAWRMASAGEVSIAIGARSAVFTPFKNLGIVVVDEEHETSYKQDETPIYNARDLAHVLGKMMSAVVILGSATPSLETYANTLRGKTRYLSLPLRVDDRALPELSVVDMRGEEDDILSGALRRAMVENFERKRQTILFLNRRGFSSLLIKAESGEVVMCPNCTVPLTYHVKGDSAVCHFCGTAEVFGDLQAALGEGIKKVGMGTEKVERTVRRLLPEAEVARMDSDTVSGKRSLLSLYRRLEKGEIDVVVGTQLVAKGHDLPGVTLVGVISADLALGMPDFRSSERTFQLITQVAGRSGRGDEPGRVFVQTYNPESPSVGFALKQDSIGFMDREMELRRELQYPPFSKLIKLRISGRREQEAGEAARLLGERARKLLSGLKPGELKIRGPSPAPIYKIRNRFRWHMLLGSEDIGVLHKFSRALKTYADSTGLGGVRVVADVDPLSFS